MAPGSCVCGFRPAGNVQSTGRSLVNHIKNCKQWKQKAQEKRDNAKRQISDTDLGGNEGDTLERLQKTPRLSQVGNCMVVTAMLK
jgi:hypothetical protein